MSNGVPEPPRAGLIVGISLAVLFVLIVITAVPTIGILAAIAIPNFIVMQLKAKRAELPSNIDAIRVGELAYYAAFDQYVGCGDEMSARRVVGKELRDPASDPAMPCFRESIGWQPDGKVRGAYWVTVSADGQDFEVYGVADVDGDGIYAQYVATRDEPVRMVSYEHNY